MVTKQYSVMNAQRKTKKNTRRKGGVIGITFINGAGIAAYGQWRDTGLHVIAVGNARDKQMRLGGGNIESCGVRIGSVRNVATASRHGGRMVNTAHPLVGNGLIGSD